MVILRYTINGLAFRRDFHDDSLKVKLRTLSPVARHELREDMSDPGSS